jgi:hypothetical protein
MSDQIAVIKDDILNKWLIALNPRVTRGPGIDPEQSQRGQPRLECDFVWNGERWASDWSEAVLFASRESAEEYRQINAEKIER